MEAFKEYWPVMISAVAGLVWLVRVESKTLTNDREIKRLWEQRKEDLNVAKESRDDVKATLTQVNDKLDELQRFLMQERNK